MSSSVVSNSCRLTIISSTLRVDLAVPVQIAVAELLSLVVASLGRETADRGAAEGGWILQRAGEDALDPSTSIGASQLRDGDTLYLRTRATGLPDMAFDDVLDAVATGVLSRTGRWKAVHTRRATSVFAAALLVFALLTMLALGPRWTTTALTTGATAALLLLAATAVGRVYRQGGPALTAAGFAIAFAVACGATAVGQRRELVDFGAPQALVGVGAAVLASTVALLVLGRGFAGFVTVVTVSVLTAIGTGVATVSDLDAGQTAAVIATVALAVSPFLPTFSFRLARLPLPTIPQDAADLRREVGAVDGPHILAQAARADQFLTGLVGGVSLGIAGAAVLLSDHGVTRVLLACVLGLICLLRARLFTGRAQRILLLVSGGVALLAVLVNSALDMHGAGRVWAFAVPAVVVAVVLVLLAVVLPERRYTPPVSRAADIVESLLVLSVIPLALGVMGVYGKVRGLTS